MKKILIKTTYIMVVVLVMLSMSGFSVAPQSGEGDGSELVRITQVDTSNFPQVTVYISVVDQDGKPVNIDPSRLVLMENDQVIQLDQTKGIGEIGPLTTMLVMDVSGSMNSAGKLEAAKAAAAAYVDQMRKGDRAGIVVFNTAIKYVQPITNDPQALKSVVRGLRAMDDTAMYDALVQSVEILDGEQGRKAIIVLTDGLDNVSQYKAADVLDLIGPSGLSISTVGLGEPGQSTAALTALDEAALRDLAKNAGGLYGYANDEKSLSNLYANYAIAMQSEYVITYTSPSLLRDGFNRAISVSISESDGLAAQKGERIVYNPGGLVPEVEAPATWAFFFSLLGGLGLLLFLPGLGGLAAGALPSGKGFKRSKSKASRIKLK
ncbi:MAG: VWA domain-containing protein [Anaerolineae bacterium]|nr:VWA domain-containing protein [Anaerolineae bacterium]